MSKAGIGAVERSAAPLRITGALFDCDGTLLDSLSAWRGLEEMLAAQARVVVSDEEHRAFSSFTIPEVARYFHEVFGLARSTEGVIRIIDEYMMNHYENEAELLPGVDRLLESCAGSGVRMSVTSSSAHEYLEAGLSCAGIRDYFDAVVSVNDVGASKREPLIFNHACALLGTARATTWGFEDSVYAMDALRGAGFPVVGIYGAAADQRREVERAADVAVSSWENVVVDAGCVKSLED